MGDTAVKRVESESVTLEALFEQWTDPVVPILLIRLVVLYEDLRIEHRASLAADLGPIDVNGLRYRQFYFHRRLYATLQEIHGAMHQLNGSAEFRAHLKARHGKHWGVWRGAVEYFNSHAPLIKTRRNMFGGHFGNRAATVARGMLATVSGRMACDVDKDRRTYDPSHLFALQLATLVFFEGIDVATSQAHSREAEAFIVEAMTHAGNAVLALCDRCFVSLFPWPCGFETDGLAENLPEVAETT